MSTIDNCPLPDPCDLQTFEVNASSTFPPSEAKWKVALPRAEHVIYQNMVYLLIGLLISLVSIMFTKLAKDGDMKSFTRKYKLLRVFLTKMIDEENESSGS